jgi:hypothetical protein
MAGQRHSGVLAHRRAETTVGDQRTEHMLKSR